jgi:hypothetical protein
MLMTDTYLYIKKKIKKHFFRVLCGLAKRLTLFCFIVLKKNADQLPQFASLVRDSYLHKNIFTVERMCSTVILFRVKKN